MWGITCECVQIINYHFHSPFIIIKIILKIHVVADSCLHPGIEHIILLKCLNLSKLSLCLALWVFFLSHIHHVPLKFATCMPNTEWIFKRMNLKTTPSLHTAVIGECAALQSGRIRHVLASCCVKRMWNGL